MSGQTSYIQSFVFTHSSSLDGIHTLGREFPLAEAASTGDGTLVVQTVVFSHLEEEEEVDDEADDDGNGDLSEDDDDGIDEDDEEDAQQKAIVTEIWVENREGTFKVGHFLSSGSVSKRCYPRFRTPATRSTARITTGSSRRSSRATRRSSDHGSLSK